MIKKFKLFERYIMSSELVDKLDDDDIETLYDENYSISVSELIYMMPSYVWDNFDKEKFLNDFINDMINGQTLEDFNEYDLKKYIESNFTTQKEQKILDIYNSNNDEDESEYEDNMLDDLDDDELREVIEDSNEEEEFIREITEKSYTDAEDVFSDFCGIDVNDNKNMIDKNNKHKIYNSYSQYVDDDGIIQSWKDGEDFEEKKNYVKDNINYIGLSIEIQKKLLESEKSNALLLFDYFENYSTNRNQQYGNISNKYNFQKAYIEAYMEDNFAGAIDDADEDDKEEISELRAKSLKNLYDSFGLNSKLEEEFTEDMWMINSDKFNL